MGSIYKLKKSDILMILITIIAIIRKPIIYS